MKNEQKCQKYSGSRYLSEDNKEQARAYEKTKESCYNIQEIVIENFQKKKKLKENVSEILI